ncbi:hypothetical protein D3C81_1878440 [compost metagenome]
MHRSNPLHDCQSQPGALATPGTITAGERVEDRLQLRRIDPGTTVHDAQHHIRCAGVPGYIRRHLHTTTGMMQRIADQVVQQSFHRHTTQRERLDRLQAQSHSLFILVIGRGDLTDQVTQVDLFH